MSHPIEVAALLREHFPADQELLAAALCHDLLEDTQTSALDIANAVGEVVAALVVEVTDVSKPEDGNRVQRKAIDREHLKAASQRGQTLKCADVISNARTVAYRDPAFAHTYLREKAELLEVLEDADPVLLCQAKRTVDEALAVLASGDQ